MTGLDWPVIVVHFSLVSENETALQLMFVYYRD